MKFGKWSTAALLFAVTFAPKARAQSSNVIVTITGTVHDGSDTTGTFGLGTGYSFTSNPDVQPFTLTLTYDPTVGVQNYGKCGTPTNFTGINGGGTATLSINGNPSFPFGGGTMGETSISSYFGLWAYGGCTYSRAGIGVQPQYSANGYSGGSSVGYSSGAFLAPTNAYSANTWDWISTSADWRTVLSPGTAMNSTFRIPFNIAIYYPSGTTFAWASGTLSPTNMKIEGPPCLTPIGETTAAAQVGWDDANGQPEVYQWEPTIQEMGGGVGNFNGLSLAEQSGGAPADSCWFTGSQVPKAVAIADSYLSPWYINSDDTFGPDYVGWTLGGGGMSARIYYRGGTTGGYTGTNVAPCGATLKQQMKMYCPVDHNWYTYGKPNTLEELIGSSTITSNRAGQTSSPRVY